MLLIIENPYLQSLKLTMEIDDNLKKYSNDYFAVNGHFILKIQSEYLSYLAINTLIYKQIHFILVKLIIFLLIKT